jgi:hypothetical protein
MDYDDIRIRLERTFKSINSRFDEDVLGNINYNSFKQVNSHGFSVSFGKDDAETLMNRILIILYNLASFKDHIKNCLRKNNIDVKVVETEIDNSIHLQVLIDIINLEKHGTPLRNSRSGKSPVIKNPMQALTLSSGTEPNSGSYFSMHPDGEVVMGGNVKISIVAEIYDDQNNVLFQLDEMIEKSLAKWESLIVTYRCC